MLGHNAKSYLYEGEKARGVGEFVGILPLRVFDLSGSSTITRKLSKIRLKVCRECLRTLSKVPIMVLSPRSVYIERSKGGFYAAR